MRRRLAKRADVLRKAALDYHAGRITLRELLAVIRQFRLG